MKTEQHSLGPPDWLNARIVPPLTVLERPLAASWRASAGPGRELAGTWCRDARGDTRLDYDDPPRISRLWKPATHTMAWLSHADRTVRIALGKPKFPAPDRWAPTRPWRFSFSAERRVIHGLDCARVELSPPPIGVVRDELWAAPEWGLVLLDVLETAEFQHRWEITELDRSEPQQEIFIWPADYRRLD